MYTAQQMKKYLQNELRKFVRHEIYQFSCLNSTVVSSYIMHVCMVIVHNSFAGSDMMH